MQQKLEFIDTTNNHNVVLCKGKPVSIEDDVQYYCFECSICKSGHCSQPQFYDEKHFMCAECAIKINFKDVYHNNSNKKLLDTHYGNCLCSACSYRKNNATELINGDPQ